MSLKKKPKIAAPEPVYTNSDQAVTAAGEEEKKRLANGQTQTLLTSGQGANADGTLLSQVQLGGDEDPQAFAANPFKKKNVMLG